MGTPLLTITSHRGKDHQQGWSLVEVSFAVLLFGIISAVAIPSFISIRRNAQTSGDARDLTDAVMLAKLRAAADFTHSRVYADLTANAFHIETWNKTTGYWTTEGGVTNLFKGDSFGFGNLTTPPTGTQSSIAQAPVCQALTGGSGTIANTACIVFNSRGVPVDSSGTTTGNDAFYITDGASVYAITVSATGLFTLWRTDSHAASWQKR